MFQVDILPAAWSVLKRLSNDRLRYEPRWVRCCQQLERGMEPLPSSMTPDSAPGQFWTLGVLQKTCLEYFIPPPHLSHKELRSSLARSFFPRLYRLYHLSSTL